LSSCRLRGLSDDDGYELDSLFDARMDSCLQITFTRQACQSMHALYPRHRRLVVRQRSSSFASLTRLPRLAQAPPTATGSHRRWMQVTHQMALPGVRLNKETSVGGEWVHPSSTASETRSAAGRHAVTSPRTAHHVMDSPWTRRTETRLSIRILDLLKSSTVLGLPPPLPPRLDATSTLLTRTTTGLRLGHNALCFYPAPAVLPRGRW
jgi:hypothetical protein